MEKQQNKPSKIEIAFVHMLDGDSEFDLQYKTGYSIDKCNEILSLKYELEKKYPNIYKLTIQDGV